MKVSYGLHKYSDANLCEVLRNKKISAANLKKRPHFNYFSGYLKNIGAKTIIVENDYVSRAYLKDYSNYYSTCFQNYDRFCKRVHFFDKDFDVEKFEKELLDPKSKFLDTQYLGYIVIKPLPDSIIGPTLLKTYKKDNEGFTRHYPSCRDYKINLFGKQLSLCSLAYQEQDTVVAACASVAIWSAFHKTSIIFNTDLPSPSQITQRAGNSFNNYGRTFPNPGLDISQICKAIEKTGLVSEFIISDKFKSNVKLAKQLIYAYSKAGLPILLFLTFDDGNNDVGHLVTVNGFSNTTETKEPTKDISLLADRISKFYAHDDQVGPFAKFIIEGGEVIQEEWKNEEGVQITGRIYSVIIPIYKKIRIKFQDVFDNVSKIDLILFRSNIFSEEVEWDIYLIESNTYKNNIIHNPEIKIETKKKIVTSNYPKYIWVAKATILNISLFDIIYDSTDFALGHFYLGFNLLFDDKSFKRYLKENFESYKTVYTEEIKGPKIKKKLFDKIILDLG